MNRRRYLVDFERNRMERDNEIKSHMITGLETIRDGLWAGEYVHGTVPRNKEKEFNMGLWFIPHCNYGLGGPVGCIGGYLAREISASTDMAMSAASQWLSEQESLDDELRNLFFPPVPINDGYRLITCEQAAEAIDNYLVDGDPKWDEVL